MLTVTLSLVAGIHKKDKIMEWLNDIFDGIVGGLEWTGKFIGDMFGFDWDTEYTEAVDTTGLDGTTNLNYKYDYGILSDTNLPDNTGYSEVLEPGILDYSAEPEKMTYKTVDNTLLDSIETPSDDFTETFTVELDPTDTGKQGWWSSLDPETKKILGTSLAVGAKAYLSERDADRAAELYKERTKTNADIARENMELKRELQEQRLKQEEKNIHTTGDVNAETFKKKQVKFVPRTSVSIPASTAIF